MVKQYRVVEADYQLKFSGESRLRIFLQAIVVVPLIGMILFAFFISFNLIGKLIFIGVFLLLLYLFIDSAIKNVILKNDYIQVEKLSGRKIIYNYDFIKRFVIKQQLDPHPALFLGELDKEIIVVELVRNKKSEITFFCPEDKKIELNEFLRSKGLRMFISE